MKDSTVPSLAELPRPEVALVIDVTSLYGWLQRLPDHRDPRGVRYPLPDVLTLMVLAKLAGEDQPAGIAHWAHPLLPHAAYD